MLKTLGSKGLKAIDSNSTRLLYGQGRLSVKPLKVIGR